MKRITVVGIGMGNRETLTIAAKEAILKAQVLIGAKRMVEACQAICLQEVKTVYSYNRQEIASFVQSCEEKEIVIVMSGDTGFYSGAKELKEVLPKEHMTILPGISSVSYFFSKIGESWEDANLVSAHGREVNVVQEVKRNRKTFFLTARNVSELCSTLTEASLGEVEVFIGENLSYPEERIYHGTAEKFCQQSFDSLSVMVVINENAQKTLTIGIEDEAFIRGKVPMTKSEVRAVILSKLKLKYDGIAYDIGAGTGSVSIEMALNMGRGRVYAIETNKEAVSLLGENKEKFQVNNIHIVEGMAPEALETLPCPDSVFIGGSKGTMEGIITAIGSKAESNHKEKVQLVVSAIALETVMETLRVFEEQHLEDVDAAMVQVSKAKSVASYHMMMGQNPIYIISGSLKPTKSEGQG